MKRTLDLGALRHRNLDPGDFLGLESSDPTGQTSNGGIVTGCVTHCPPTPKRPSQHWMTRFSVLKVGKPLLNSSVAPQC